MKRTSIVLEESLLAKVKEISTDIDRSMNYTISLLLQRAVKEATRKRNGRKNNTEHNSANMGTGNTE